MFTSLCYKRFMIHYLKPVPKKILSKNLFLFSIYITMISFKIFGLQ